MIVEKYNEMKEGNQLFSWAESAEFAGHAVQTNLREQTVEAKKSRIEEGKRTSLELLLLHKYDVNDVWADALTTQQVEDALVSILECSTYDTLEIQLTDRKTEQFARKKLNLQ